MTTDPTKINAAFDPLTRRISGVATHGNTPFDVPFISEVTPNLWQGGCENGLILPSEVKHLVSLYPWERYDTYSAELDSELYFKMYDSLRQSASQIEEIAHYVNARRRTGITLVHCQAGLNRSSLIVARALMLDGPMDWDEAISIVRRRSPACLCNPAFERYLRNL